MAGKDLAAIRRSRTATLKKKAEELSVLCRVRVGLVCADGDGSATPEVWESVPGVLDAYRAVRAEVRAAHAHRAHAEAELGKAEAKLARVRQAGPHALSLWDKAIDDMDAEEVERLLAAIDAKLVAVEDRRRALDMPVGHGHGHGGGGGLLEGLAPLMPAAAAPGSGNNLEGYPLMSAQGEGDANNGLVYEDALWANGMEMQLHYGVQQSPGAGGGADMNGYQLQSMAVGMNGYGDTSHAWDASQSQPRGADPTYHGYAPAFGGMSGYHNGTQSNPHNGGLLQPNLQHNAVTPAGYDHSHDIGHGYFATPAAHIAQESYYGSSSFINAPPPALSHPMGTGDNFTNPEPAQPLAAYYGGDLVNASAYTPQRGLDMNQLQSASSSKQSGIEQLHYFSDVEDGLRLHLRGN